MMRKNMFFSLILFAVICTSTLAFCGCEKKVSSLKEEGKECDYTVVATRDCPEEFLSHLEEKKINPFQITYQDGSYLYIAVGYGEQKTGGYSIVIKGLLEKSDKLCIETELRGPGKDETVKQKPSYPYVIIKTENSSKEVIFESH